MGGGAGRNWMTGIHVRVAGFTQLVYTKRVREARRVDFVTRDEGADCRGGH